MIAAIALLFLYSCNKFCRCEPLPRGAGLRIKFLNSAGQNLFFGASARYKPDSFQVLTIQNGQLTSISNAYSEDSITLVTQINTATKFYFSYSSVAPKDSIEIKWRTYTEKCCNEKFLAYEIAELKFNTAVVSPAVGIYTFIK